MKLLKRLFTFAWLLLSSFVLFGCGWAALGLLTFWGIGVSKLIQHEISRDAWEFIGLSALVWFMAIGWAIMVRIWWRYVVQVVRGE